MGTAVRHIQLPAYGVRITKQHIAERFMFRNRRWLFYLGTIGTAIFGYKKIIVATFRFGVATIQQQGISKASAHIYIAETICGCSIAVVETAWQTGKDICTQVLSIQRP